MVYLHWIYGIVGALTSTFVQLYIYERFTSVAFNIIGLIVYFMQTGLFCEDVVNDGRQLRSRFGNEQAGRSAHYSRSIHAER